jgi:FAD/FMN-containing dehydrogenase
VPDDGRAAYMRRVLEMQGDDVRIQPGLVHAQLNEFLRPLGRQFGPDPAMSSVTTMGSVIAIDAGGSHWLKYGSARAHVKRLQIVLADGQVLDVGRESLDEMVPDVQSRRGQLVWALADLLAREEQTIRDHQPKSLVNRCGYQLADVLSERHLDLRKLLVGSEGTLALIMAADNTPTRLASYVFADRKFAAHVLCCSNTGHSTRLAH